MVWCKKCLKCGLVVLILLGLFFNISYSDFEVKAEESSFFGEFPRVGDFWILNGTIDIDVSGRGYFEYAANENGIRYRILANYSLFYEPFEFGDVILEVKIGKIFNDQVSYVKVSCTAELYVDGNLTGMGDVSSPSKLIDGDVAVINIPVNRWWTQYIQGFEVQAQLNLTVTFDLVEADGSFSFSKEFSLGTVTIFMEHYRHSILTIKYKLLDVNETVVTLSEEVNISTILESGGIYRAFQGNRTISYDADNITDASFATYWFFPPLITSNLTKHSDEWLSTTSLIANEMVIKKYGLVESLAVKLVLGDFKVIYGISGTYEPPYYRKLQSSLTISLKFPCNSSVLGSFYLFENTVAETFSVNRTLSLSLSYPSLPLSLLQHKVKIDAPKEVGTGETFQINLTVVNEGCVTLENAEIYVSSSNFTPSTLSFPLGDLQSGDIVEINFTLMAPVNKIGGNKISIGLGYYYEDQRYYHSYYYTVSVYDSIPPSIEILSPVDGSVFNESEAIPLRWKVYDNIGIKCVKIYVDNVSLGEVIGNTSLYLGPGVHQVLIVAEDVYGNVENASVQFSVEKEVTPVEITYHNVTNLNVTNVYYNVTGTSNATSTSQEEEAEGVKIPAWGLAASAAGTTTLIAITLTLILRKRR